MRIPRVFLDLPLAVGQQLPLPQKARQHLERVLRLKPGHPVIVFNGQGGQFAAELLGDGELSVLAFEAVECESPLPARVIQGLSKGERMDLTLQKATELGATRISPVTTERSVVRLDEERQDRRMQRWMGILQSACEQCGRNRLPRLDEPSRLEAVLAAPSDGATRIVLAPEGTASLAELGRPAALEVLIGPEGGLSEAEIAQALQAGFTPVHLGPRILRTETAGLALLAAAQTLWGDFV
ncbi:MAG: 16S rRNA (uracil(1498)-N(3))-methyltransferase [Gammaproteobacteria bacterium]|nr:16S rRNA (uracil(1498)-N(3))-methyltransferase [Gammaproteobacteria bacterium]